MLTQTVTITQNSTPNIIIGRRSTYETQQVIFDVSWLVQTYGEGTAELLIKRPKDASAYPVVAVLDGNTLTWTVSETDTQDKGHGECEIYWYVNGGLAKSCICGITILRDIGDTTETAPDPYETWVDELARLGAETLANAQAAEQSANDAAQSASEADNSAAAALESEENALNSENAAKASEQAAAASAQGAEQSATAARQSAAQADQSATNAHDDATDASASADRAEQAAASIEGDTERAEAAAQMAQGAASDASGFAGTASTKATEAAGSAATAEQAANTATQKASDASASATAAAGSASSASASATAAGNAQTAAETAQGKAEDAQEAAETAAQSIEDSAAQIDQNTEDILDLKSALNTKAGILRDTASGAIASFVPDSTVPNLLGLTVELEPIQDLHGYDSPWPAGGGKNLIPLMIDGLKSLNTAGTWNGNVYTQSGVTFDVKTNSDGAVTSVVINGTASANIRFRFGNVDVKSGVSYTITGFKSVPSTFGNINPALVGTSDANLSSKVIQTADSDKTCMMSVYVLNGGTVTNYVLSPMIRVSTNGDDTFAPYSNICPISGRDSVEVEAAGKNLLAPTEYGVIGYAMSAGGNLKGTYNCSITQITDGYSVSIPTSWTGAVFATGMLPAGTYHVHFKVNDSSARFSVYKASENLIVESNELNVASATTTDNNVTLTKPGRIAVFCGKGSTGTIDVLELQVEVGSAYSSYARYSAQTYTIQLGETVYGGDVGVVSGSGENKIVKDTFNLAGRYYTTANGFDSWTLNLTHRSTGGIDSANKICDCAGYTYAGVAAGTSHFYVTVTVAVIYLPEGAHRSDTITIAYPLATPTALSTTPTEISTVGGQNNVFSPAGDVTVEFAADLKTYIDNKIAAAVAAMS